MKKNKQPRSKLRGSEQQEPKTYAASGGEYDPKRFTTAKHRLSPMHIVAAAAFLFATLFYVGIRVSGAPGETAGSMRSAVIHLALISMLFLYIDLWAHEEDRLFSKGMLAAPLCVRLFDLFFRLVAYTVLTAFVVRHEVAEFSVDREFGLTMLRAYPDVVVLFVTLLGGIWWLRVVAPYRSRFETDDTDRIVVQPASRKFDTPYIVLAIAWVLCGISIILQNNVEVVVEYVWRLLALESFGEPGKNGYVVGTPEFLLVMAILIACSSMLTRRHYWMASFTRHRSW